MKKFILSLATVFFMSNAFASDLSIDMLNKRDDGKRMVYSVEVAKIEKGQTITWVAKDKGHNVEMITGPDGYVLPKKSKLSKDVSLTFDTPGIYLYKCTPHVGMGMIGLVVVGGDTSNKEAILKVKLSGKSKKKRNQLVSEI